MRYRTTYLFPSGQLIDPKKLEINKNSISSVSPVTIATEEKITFRLDELPSEIQRLQQISHEINIRWVSQSTYEAIDPIVSSLSPGLHLFYTPRVENNLTTICSIVRKAFGELDCVDSKKSFTIIKSNRQLNETYLQFYDPLPSVSKFAEYLNQISCSELSSHLSEYCIDRVNTLKTASTLDISLLFKSNTATISSFTSFQKKILSLQIPNELISEFKARYEVGLLTKHQSRGPEEMSLGGFLIVLGTDVTPTPTVFSFSSRHHSSNDSFKSSFLEPSGMHPNLELRVSDVTAFEENQSCKLYAYLTLPRTIFIDKYQFIDKLFLEDRNIAELGYISDNVDLEAPEYTIGTWGTVVLIRLTQPSAKLNQGREWVARVPTHLRYLLPISKKNGIREIEIPFPIMFWACATEETFDFSKNPFDRVHLGYDGLFNPNTLFYHLKPYATWDDGRLVSSLKVPVLDLDNSDLVEKWTYIAIGFGFFWVLSCLLKVFIKTGYASTYKEAIDSKRKTQ